VKSIYQHYIARFFTTGPIVFPLLALFLLVLSAYEIHLFWLDGKMYATPYMLRPLFMLAYTVSMFGVSFMRKWAVYAFIGVTVLSVSILLLAGNESNYQNLGELLYKPLPINLLISVLILFFFKKFK